MKKQLSKLLILAFVLNGSAHADPQANTVQGVDATALIDYLKASMFTVTSPFKVYHFFEGWGEYQGQFPSDDERGFKYVQYNAHQYLNKFGRDYLSAYGQGLYAATDPVSSVMWGHTKDWQLAEISIPVGFRLVKVQNGNFVPQGVWNVLSSLECEHASQPGMDIKWLFYSQTYSQAKPRCIDGIREIFERLKIDAFTYEFFGSYLSQCKKFKDDHSQAFVFTSDRWLKPDNVRLFNSKTPDAKIERRRIESIYYKSGADTNVDDWGIKTPYPQTISEDNLSYSQHGVPSVHWQDLDGETTDADIDSWIKDNLFNCGDNLNYEKTAN